MKHVTQAQVAQAAGVSRGLVSLALAGDTRVAAPTRKRIIETAEKLGYTRNLGAAALASARSSLVGVVMPDLRNPYFESFMQALQDAAEARGFNPLAAISAREGSREENMIRYFEQMRVAGIILVTTSLPPHVYDALAERVPTVVAGMPAVTGRASVVHVDEYAAAQQALVHLQERGCTRVVYVVPHEVSGPGENDAAVRYRKEAVQQAARDAQISLEIIETAMDDAAQVAAYAQRQLERYAARPAAQNEEGKTGRHRAAKIGYAVHNDALAINIIPAMRSLGIEVGHDISLLSWDNTYLAGHAAFSLTSIDQQAPQQVEIALDVIEGKAGAENMRGIDGVVQPRLVVRSSS